MMSNHVEEVKESESQANSWRLLLGENGGLLRLCSSRITVTYVLMGTVVFLEFFYCHGSSVVALWMCTLLEAIVRIC